jgi:hypothetical protein
MIVSATFVCQKSQNFYCPFSRRLLYLVVISMSISTLWPEVGYHFTKRYGRCQMSYLGAKDEGKVGTQVFIRRNPCNSFCMCIHPHLTLYSFSFHAAYSTMETAWGDSGTPVLMALRTMQVKEVAGTSSYELTWNVVAGLELQHRRCMGFSHRLPRLIIRVPHPNRGGEFHIPVG